MEQENISSSSQEIILPTKNKKKAKEEIRAIVRGEIEPIAKYEKFIKSADSVIASSTLFINNIRVSEINDEAKSCDCIANVTELNDGEAEKVLNIEYKAQYSVDGVLNVSVKFEDLN